MTTASSATLRTSTTEGATSISGPKLVLHLEGLAAFGAATAAYFLLGHGWGLFAILFLAPDLFMLGYLAGPRVGAIAYDVGHSYLGPLALLALGHLAALPTLVAVALIWAAHVGFDRMLGYGLKYASGFRDTHLGRV